MCSVAPPKCLICDDFFDRKPILLGFGDGEMEPTMAEILTTYREGFKVFWNLSNDDKEAKENEIDILSEFVAASGVMDHPCCEPCFEKLKELQSCQETIREKKELQKELVKGMMEDFQHVKSSIIAQGKWRMANSATVDKWDSLKKKINKHIGLDPETLDSAEENDAKPVVRPPDDNKKENKVKVKLEVVDKKSPHLKTGTQTRKRKSSTHTLSAINKNTKNAKKKPDNKNTKDDKKKPDMAKAIKTKKTQPLKKRQRLENPKTGTVSMSLKERLERVGQGEVCYCDGCGKGIQNAQFFMCTSCLTMKEDGSIGFDLCLQCYATRRVHTHHNFKRVFHYCKI